MNVKSVERNGNQATIVVEIDKELMERGVNSAYMKARKSIMIPGFRKGKAPRKMIEAMYGAHVFYEDGLEEIFPEIYEFAVASQDGFKAIGRPSLTDMQIADDNTVTLTLTTDVYPEVTLGQYKGLEVEKAEPTVTDAQVQAELDAMAKNVASTENVDRPAEMGDTANIDFEGFDNGVPFEGGKGENFDLTLGSHSFVPGFEEQIVGMNVGEEKDIDITFPEDYHKDLAGKAVVFHVKVNKLTMNIIPEQDDEFAKDVSEFDTLDEYKKEIKDNLTKKKEEQAKTEKENAVVDKAVENATMEIPEAMIDTQVENMVDDFARRIQSQGLSMEQYMQFTGATVDSLKEQMKPQAVKRIESRLVLEKVAEAENIQISDEKLDEELAKMAEMYKMELDKFKELVGEYEKEQMKKDLAVQEAVTLMADSAKEA